MKGHLSKILGVLVVVAMVSTMLAACGPTPEPQVVKETVVVTEKETVVVTEKETIVETVEVETEVEKVVTATPEPTRKIVTVAWTQEPDSLNPWYTNMWFSAVLQQAYLCWAWEFDDQNEAFPRLVTEIPSIENGGLSEDGLVITLNLRDDIVWSDGTPITAEDFVFTYQMIMDPANIVDTQYPYDYLVSVEAPDERTVVMNFSEPFVPWLAQYWRGLLPKHILGPVFDSEGSIEAAEWNLAPTVGCGPFNFAEWESGSFIRFTKNENYWLGAPKLDEVYFQFVPDDAAQTAACVAGDVDLGYWPPYSDVPILQAAGLELVTQASGYNEGWFFNFRDMASPAILDVRVRQAIAQALDRNAITEDLLLGLTKPNVTFWDAEPAYISPDITPWEYKPEAAAQLLEDAGWTDRDGDGIREDADGNKLTITQGNTTKQIRRDTQAVAQQQLLQVGIDLQTFAYDSDFLFESYANGGPAAIGDLDIMEWSDAPYFPDPDSDYWLCSQMPSPENEWGYNYFGCDEELDALFQQQLLAVNPQDRIQILHQITQLMHERVYYLGMWEDPDIWIIGSRLTGTKYSGVTPFYNIGEWDVVE
jgi:peptide/nickel transport system substrate-binding protein